MFPSPLPQHAAHARGGASVLFVAHGANGSRVYVAVALKVAYLAHDLDDPSIWRRVAMLESGGAQVRVAGFRRGGGPVPEGAVVLGQTSNGRMVQRAGAVLRALPRVRSRLRILGAADVILARNLEMLLLGRAAVRDGTALVYELLDVHDLMLGGGAASRALRGLEGRLMQRAAAVIISSPGFERHYLEPFARPRIPTLLVENKLLPQGGGGPEAGPRRADAGPLRIGWFGMLRCRWSLQTLDALTRAAPGRFHVLLRGRPAYDQIPDFDAVVAVNPALSFDGPYRWPDDLPAIYGQVDLTWMIDRYQAGGNSDWLLPNRLYEGGRHGAVPVALAGTEMARKLEALGIGVVVSDTRLDGIAARLGALDAGSLDVLRAAVAALPRATWEASDSECRALVVRLEGLRAPRLRGVAQPGRPAAEARR